MIPYLRFWLFGFEAVIETDEEPLPVEGEIWTRCETVALFVRRDPWGKEPRAFRWKYDGRPRFTLRMFGWSLELWRDYIDIYSPA